MTDHPSSLPALPAHKPSRRDRLKHRLLSSASHSLQLASSARQALAPHVSAKLDAAVDWLTSPEQAQHLQQAAASFAGLGMRLGFKADPRAHLLFELADLLEQEHGRLPILQCLLAHNPILDNSLLELVRLRFSSAHDRAPYDRALATVRAHLLSMLAELAALELQEPVPEDKSTESLTAFFHSAGLPERFHPLPLLAAGDPDALAQHDPQPAPRTRLRDLIRGRTTSHDPDAADQPASTALTTLSPLGYDPAFQFLFQSYTFFLQSYLARGLIEELPGILSWARDIDHAHKQSQQQRDPSIIDLPKG